RYRPRSARHSPVPSRPPHPHACPSPTLPVLRNLRYTVGARERRTAMAEIVLGIGTSHTPMLNAPPEDWPRFIERDSRRDNLLDIDGRLTTYEAQLHRAPPGIMAEIAPDRMRARHAAVEGAMARLGD